MIDVILAPTDFSEGSRQSVDYALEIATRFNAAVTLLHVGDVTVDLESSAPGARAEIYHRAREESARVARARMDALLAQVRAATPNVEIDGRFVSGVAHQAIIETAKEVDADMIVMGTAGLTGFSHFLIGSTAERVVRVSPIPVLTVRGK